MTDLERIGQRLVTGFPGTALTPELVQVVKEYKIGNIILFRENIASADQLRTLCADLQTLIRSETGHDAFIMIDQEGRRCDPPAGKLHQCTRLHGAGRHR